MASYQPFVKHELSFSFYLAWILSLSGDFQKSMCLRLKGTSIKYEIHLGRKLNYFLVLIAWLKNIQFLNDFLYALIKRRENVYLTNLSVLIGKGAFPCEQSYCDEEIQQQFPIRQFFMPSNLSWELVLLCVVVKITSNLLNLK